VDLEQFYLVLLVGAAVVLVSVVATRAASVVGLPSLLLFLGLGVVLGEDVIGLRFDDARLAQRLGTAALAVILIEGGLTTRWRDIRPTALPAAALATVGVGVSTLVTGVAAHVLLGMSWQLALLVGATVSSTDAAAVFSVLRVVPLPRRVSGLLEAESGLNDAPTVILVLVFSDVPFRVSAGDLVWQIGYELAAGAAIGLVVGFAGAAGLRRVELPASGLYPLATFALGMVAFAAAGAAHASGFLAAYLAALVLADAGLPYRGSIRSFAEGLGWLAQIGLFVLLGLLVTPSHLGAAILPAFLTGLVLLLLARPLGVLLCLLPFRFGWRELIFVSWAGLRGAVPIVLTTFAIVRGAPQSGKLLDIVFVLVVLYTLIQGPSLLPIARRLRMSPQDAARQVSIEIAPLDVLDAELMTLTIPSGSRLDGVTPLELALPAPSVITLVVRDGRPVVPERLTQLRAGDELLIVTTRSSRPATEERLRAVSRSGRLAKWRGDTGERL